MRKAFGFAILAVLISATAWAQEMRHEFTVQGSGFFPKQTTESDLRDQPTYSGGVMAGYRFNINNWLAAEGNYDYFRNEEKFIASSGTTRIPMNVHGATGLAVVKLPALRRFKPFAVAGGGAMVFDPRNSSGFGRQTRGAFVYGGGADYSIMTHVSLRAEYRGFVYKIPDFDINNLNMDKVTHAAVPSAGLVIRF